MNQVDIIIKLEKMKKHLKAMNALKVSINSPNIIVGADTSKVERLTPPAR